MAMGLRLFAPPTARVAWGLPVRDVLEGLPHALLERGAFGRKRQVEGGALAGEVLLELVGGAVRELARGEGPRQVGGAEKDVRDGRAVRGDGEGPDDGGVDVVRARGRAHGGLLS